MSLSTDRSALPPPSTASRSASGLLIRAWGIVCAPQTEWLLVSKESTTSLRVLAGYVAPLAGLAALVPLLRLPLQSHAPSSSTLLMAALTFCLELIGVCALGGVVNALAPFFGGVHGWRQALQIAAYSLTPLWLTVIFVSLSTLASALPLVSVLYCTYLLYRGVSVLMKSPRHQAFGYATTTLLCAIALGILFVEVGYCIAAGK